MTRRYSLLPVAAILAVLADNICAQDLEPRQYANIPVGLNFLVAGYAWSEGGVLFDPSIALENAAVDFDGPVLAYARGLDVGGLSAKIDAAIGRVCLSGAADYRGQRLMRDVCGLTDSRARFSVNFLGAPARSLAEFAEYRHNLVAGASISITAPTGQYDADRLVNIGTNRWATKLEIGMSKAVRRWLIEVAAAATFFDDNDDFFNGVVRTQDSLTAMQLHFVRILSSGRWLAFDATKYSGGKTRTDGRPDLNRQSSTRLGITFSIPVAASQSIRLNASSGVTTRTGSDFDTVGIVWQYRWGGGLPR